MSERESKRWWQLERIAFSLIPFCLSASPGLFPSHRDKSRGLSHAFIQSRCIISRNEHKDEYSASVLHYLARINLYPINNASDSEDIYSRARDEHIFISALSCIQTRYLLGKGGRSRTSSEKLTFETVKIFSDILY